MGWGYTTLMLYIKYYSFMQHIDLIIFEIVLRIFDEQQFITPANVFFFIFATKLALNKLNAQLILGTSQTPFGNGSTLLCLLNPIGSPAFKSSVKSFCILFYQEKIVPMSRISDSTRVLKVRNFESFGKNVEHVLSESIQSPIACPNWRLWQWNIFDVVVYGKRENIIFRHSKMRKLFTQSSIPMSVS